MEWKKEKIKIIIAKAVLCKMTGGKCKLELYGGNWNISLIDTAAVLVAVEDPLYIIRTLQVQTCKCE